MPKPDRNPHAVVIIGGDRYDSWRDKQLFKRVAVELATDMSSEAQISLFDPRFRILDRYTDGSGVPQLVCLVYLGFGNDLGEPIFKGLLDKVERGSTDSTFMVADMGLKMRQELKNEYHNSLDDLALLRKLALRNGLRFEGPDKPPQLDKHQSLPQDEKNDWKLARERARSSGFNVFVRQDTLFAKDPARVTTPILSLEYRRDFWLLYDFDLTYKLPENPQGRPRLVVVHGRERGGRRLTGKSSEHRRGHHPRHMTRDLAIHTKSYANRRAHARKELQREPAFNLNVRSIPPLPRKRPDARNTIALNNVGKLFSGAYIADKVKYELTGSGFFADYTLYRDIN